MSQSSTIFGFLAIAFLIFITQRGELPTYWGFLVSSPKQPSGGPSSTVDGGLSGGNAADLAGAASKLSSLAESLGPTAALLL